jgi:RNA polymerase sigma-70 factor (ECF subfamily)
MTTATEPASSAPATMTAEEFDRRWDAAKGSVEKAVYPWVSMKEDREDVVQTARTKAWKARDQYDPARDFCGWVCRIATNLCRDERRAKSRRLREDQPIDLGDGQLNTDLVPDPALDPFQTACESLCATAFGRALSELPLSQSFALSLIAEGYDYEEIAKETNVPVGTVRSRIHRGRKAMIALLSLPLPNEERP